MDAVGLVDHALFRLAHLLTRCNQTSVVQIRACGDHMSRPVAQTSLLNDLRVQHSLRRKAVRVLECSRVDLTVRQLLDSTHCYRLVWDVIRSNLHRHRFLCFVDRRVDLEGAYSRQVHASTRIADRSTEDHRVVIQVKITVERRVRTRHTRRRSDIVLTLIVQCRNVVALTGWNTDRSSTWVSRVQSLPEPLTALFALSGFQAGFTGSGILSQSFGGRHQ